MSEKKAAKGGGSEEQGATSLPLDVLEHIVSFLPRIEQGKELRSWLRSAGSDETQLGREGGLLFWRLARRCYGPTLLRWASAAIAQDVGRALRIEDGPKVSACLDGGGSPVLLFSSHICLRLTEYPPFPRPKPRNSALQVTTR